MTMTAPKAGTETNDTTPTFSGAAGVATGDLPTITVNIYAGSTVTGSPVQTLTTTASAGAWSVAADTPLFDGEYTVQATQEDEADSVGASAAVTFTVNTTPPMVTLTEPAENAVVGQSKPTFSGAAGAIKGDAQSVTLTIYPGTTTTAPTAQVYVVPVSEGGWSVTPTTVLADGTYTAQATQTDAAGNTGTSSANTFSVQTKAPGPVTSVVVAGNTGSSISLSWTNPSGPDFDGVVVRRAVGSTAPASPTEGTAVAETTGETHTLTDNTVTAGTTYSYGLFAHNALHGYAAAGTITVKATESTGGCTDTWSGATNSEWTEASNWSSGQVPSPSDWACIPAHAPNLPVTMNTPQIVDGLTNAGELVVNSSLELSDAKTKSTSTGVLTVNGTVEVTHELEASSLNLAGSLYGLGSITVPSGGSLILASGRVESGSLINDGTGTVAANDQPSVGAGAKFINDGTLSFAVGSSLNGGCEKAATDTEPAIPAGEFDNTGSVTTNGTSGTGGSAVTIGLNNYCLVTHDSGSLDVASGELKLGGGDFNFDTGSTVKGAASSQLVLEGTVSFNASSTSLPTPMVITGSTVGTGDVIASTSLKLAGQLSGSGSVTVPPAGSLVLEGGSVNSGQLVNEGTGSEVVNAPTYINPEAKFVNTGSLSFAAGSSLYGGCGHEATATEPAVPNGEFDSTGSITTTGTTKTGSSPVNIGPSSNCLVTHDTGSLDVVSGELKLGGSNFNLDAGATLTGGAGSQLNFQGTVSLNAAATTATVPIVVTGSTVGKGNLVDSSLKLAGTLNGTGTVTVPGGGSLTLETGRSTTANSSTKALRRSRPTATRTSTEMRSSRTRGCSRSPRAPRSTAAAGVKPPQPNRRVPDGEFVSSGAITTNGVASPAEIGPSRLLPRHARHRLAERRQRRTQARRPRLQLRHGLHGDRGRVLHAGARNNDRLQRGNTSLPLAVVVTGSTAGAGNVHATKLKLNGTLNGTGTWTVPTTGSVTLESGQVDGGELLNEGTARSQRTPAVCWPGREARQQGLARAGSRLDTLRRLRARSHSDGTGSPQAANS